MRDFRSWLLPGEILIWHGKPQQGIFFQRLDILMIPFSLFWGGFSLIWNLQVWTSKAPTPFALFGLPFLLIGFYIVFGRFIVDAYNRKRITYGVTNHRVIVEGSLWGGGFKSLDIRSLPGLELQESSGGRGTIRFGPPSSPFGGNVAFGSWAPSLDGTMQFISIGDVRKVYSLIHSQAAEAGRDRSSEM